ncbi:MAG: TonB-dependent receptor plug domain-containing protein [Hyphomicrobium sp.]|nr:TonB-dependent receptor plug domain-containing protein [Hyphomicrobium sp.]
MRRALPAAYAIAISTAALSLFLPDARAQSAPSTQSAPAAQAAPSLPEVKVIQQPAAKPQPAPVAAPKPKPKAQPAVAESEPAPAVKTKKKKISSSAPKPAVVKAKPEKQSEQYQSLPPPETVVEVQPNPTDDGVGNTGLAVPANATVIGAPVIEQQRPASNDTAQLLKNAPGVSIYQAGGVSGLPAINGMNDDRVRVMLNGMVVSSACANHMNPPLSYTDPAQVGSIEVLSGVTPVSKGGDSLGGTVIVESLPPRFSASGGSVETHGSISGYYRSNGDGISTSATASAASQNVAVNYAGAWSRANNYDDGRGREIASTEYEAQNHNVQLSVRNGGDLFIVQGGVQYIPYQGFVNQRMDMVNNESWHLNTRYVGKSGWGKLDARAFYHSVDHEMNFLDDKKYNTANPRQMPMLTDGSDAGYSVKAEIDVSDSDLIRVGNEFHHQSLDDWWPATMGGMMPSMMGPNTYITLNDATRNRVGTFIEWEKQWDRALSTLLGIRHDAVWMDTGNVQGYNNAPNPTNVSMMGGMPMNVGVYAGDAAAFNARNHSRTDNNIDVTALTRFEPDNASMFELGYAMKSRAPNLYERYAWSKPPAQMAMNMIGWFGDGNGYTGNLDLDSETAHTVSLTAGWHDRKNGDWNFKVTPYYTYVQDYIGVRKLGNSMGTAHAGFVNLQFANHDAELYGVNISGSMPLAVSPAFGRFALTGVAGYVHGENADTGVSLYHMMPLNGRLSLTHALGGWTSAIELDLVGGKRNVDTTRNELETAGYALVNLRTAYDTGGVRFDLGVENLFDTYFEHPLGGHYIEPTMGNRLPSLGGRQDKDNVPGVGRSLYAGVTVRF